MIRTNTLSLLVVLVLGCAVAEQNPDTPETVMQFLDSLSSLQLGSPLSSFIEAHPGAKLNILESLSLEQQVAREDVSYVEVPKEGVVNIYYFKFGKLDGVLLGVRPQSGLVEEDSQLAIRMLCKWSEKVRPRLAASLLKSGHVVLVPEVVCSDGEWSVACTIHKNLPGLDDSISLVAKNRDFEFPTVQVDSKENLLSKVYAASGISMDGTCLAKEPSAEDGEDGGAS